MAGRSELQAAKQRIAQLELAARLARRAIEVIAPEAWVVDDTGFVKDGTASPGVARQYSGTLGKGDCSGGCRDPDVSGGEFGEGVERSAAVLGRGGQVGAHGGEVLGAAGGAHAPGHLLL